MDSEVVVHGGSLESYMVFNSNTFKVNQVSRISSKSKRLDDTLYAAFTINPALSIPHVLGWWQQIAVYMSTLVHLFSGTVASKSYHLSSDNNQLS